MRKFRVEFNVDIEVEAEDEKEAKLLADGELKNFRADEVCYLQDIVDISEET